MVVTSGDTRVDTLCFSRELYGRLGNVSRVIANHAVELLEATSHKRDLEMTDRKTYQAVTRVYFVVSCGNRFKSDSGGFDELQRILSKVSSPLAGLLSIVRAPGFSHVSSRSTPLRNVFCVCCETSRLNSLVLPNGWSVTPDTQVAQRR